MAENEFDTREDAACRQNGGFNETVCIDALRVYDSCGDKDCLEDLEVYFTSETQRIVNQATNVRIRNAEVITALLDLEPVPFHKGFYSVDMTFFFDISLDVFMQPAVVPITVSGLSVFGKKVILYGSEGSVKIFSSDFKPDDADTQNTPARSLPTACVQVAEPIALSARLCGKEKCCPLPCRIPESVSKRYGGEFSIETAEKDVLATIGIFTIVRIERNVQMMIPAYDFCIPDKECTASNDSPCELFSRIDFPTNEFFPPKAADLEESSACRNCR